MEEKISIGPIVACIAPKEFFEGSNPELRGATYVDYYGTEEEWARLGQRNDGKGSYVISRVDSENKRSDRYADCIGVVGVGKRRDAEQNVSFLTHQDPKEVYWKGQEEHTKKFEKDFIETLHTLRDNSAEKSVDIVVFGGWGSAHPHDMEYHNMVINVGRLIQRELGIDATVVVGPNDHHTVTWHDGTKEDNDVAAAFDTQHRRLYVERPLQEEYRGDTSVTFKVSELSEKVEGWEDTSWMS